MLNSHISPKKTEILSLSKQIWTYICSDLPIKLKELKNVDEVFMELLDPNLFSNSIRYEEIIVGTQPRLVRFSNVSMRKLINW